jgi:hypothetical protein
MSIRYFGFNPLELDAEAIVALKYAVDSPNIKNDT